MKLCTVTLLIVACGSLSAQTEEEVKRKFYGDMHTALALKSGAVVADVGSGDDVDHALSIANAVGDSGRVVCVDINQDALDKLKRKIPSGTRNIEVHLGKPDDPFLPASTFDAVLISNAYHEMNGHQAMLLHLRDTLKRDGRLVVIEAIDNQRRQATREEQVAHHELSPDRVESELAAAGFQVVDRVEPLVIRGDGVVRYLVAATKAATVPTDPWINLRWI